MEYELTICWLWLIRPVALWTGTKLCCCSRSLSMTYTDIGKDIVTLEWGLYWHSMSIQYLDHWLELVFKWINDPFFFRCHCIEMTQLDKLYYSVDRCNFIIMFDIYRGSGLKCVNQANLIIGVESFSPHTMLWVFSLVGTFRIGNICTDFRHTLFFSYLRSQYSDKILRAGCFFF